MSNIDVIIYKVIKRSLGDSPFFVYSVESEHFFEVKDLLDLGREIKYNSQLSNSENIFIDDEIGAYRYAFEKNYSQLKDIEQNMRRIKISNDIEDVNSKVNENKSCRDFYDFDKYSWKLVRLHQPGIIKLCRRRTGETKEYKDSIFITEEEKFKFFNISNYNNQYRSHIDTHSPNYPYWSTFIDNVYKDSQNGEV